MRTVTRLVGGLLAGLLALSPAGCSGEGGKEVITESGLKYIDLKVGTGEEAKQGDVAQVHYTGWLKDGTKFDSSLDRNQPFSFKIGAEGEVIKGWNEGVLGMHVGGRRKLIIPPNLAYGEEGRGKIPANSELTFEIELLRLKK